ncbi:hypothetical protein TRFO_10388 [Tritrichomonas foetus]|uniref:GAF domain-containing protein n=1 Tax=Tritrichomonas foetus TaxID=1144522 RepID=A0A1J4J973_9EUKA|nr:hypothetical protein TRFO_10388 [Tritrichomonas foetus]|eukprot:OHS95734.1 hypothetical protein TRFO_10388 [Tritrichomonas foetus]
MNDEEEEYPRIEGGSLYIVQTETNYDDQELALQIQANANDTVDYYKKKLDSLLRKDAKLQNRLKKLHHLQHQLSLLINKNLEGKYGSAPNENPNPPKAVIPPLPPIQKGSLSEMLRTLHSVSPNELKRHISKSGIIEQLIFGDSSIFNSQLLSSVMRTPPDIQISFIEGIVDQLRECNKFYHKLIPMLSHFVLEGYLRTQLQSPNTRPSLFFSFYNKSLKSIADICGSETCQILYTTNEGQNIIYPTEKFTYIIAVEDSLSGVLLQNLKPTRIESPIQEKSFEVISEGCLFDNNHPILSIPINVGQRSTSGLVILSKPSNFSFTEEVVSKIVVEYLTPIFSLFRSIFLHVSPSHFTHLMQTIANLREDKPLFDSVKEQACELTSASFCKLFTCGSTNDYPELKVLPPEPSLVRRSYEMNTAFSYKNPRNRSDFNKEVDDEITLSKISSLLVVPVKNTPIMIVLYNATKSSEFTPIQKSLASLFTVSLPPLLNQHSMKHKIDRLKQQQDMKMKSLKTTLSSINPLVLNLNTSNFFQAVKSFLPKEISVNLFYFINQQNVLKFPDHEIIEPSKLISEIDDVEVIKSENIDYENDANGDRNIQALYVIPSFSTTKLVCLFLSTNLESFDGDGIEYYQKYARNLLLFLQSYILRYQFDEIHKRQQLIKVTTHFSLKAISSFAGTEIDCHYFEEPYPSSNNRPDLGKATAIMIETSKGIEAAITADIKLKAELPRNTLISYSAYMASNLSVKQPIVEPQAVCVSFFFDNGILDIFGCTIFKFTEWLSHISSIYSTNGFDFYERFEAVKFVNKMFTAKRWEGWFTKEEKLIIILLVLLRYIPQCWRCKVDDSLIDLIKEHAMNNPVIGLYTSVLFGAGFGLSDSLSIQKKELLLHTLNDYVIGETSTDISKTSTQVRIISFQGFKNSSESKKWLGRALILVTQFHIFAGNDEKAIEQKAKEMDEIQKKKLIYKFERVYLPMITFLSQRNEPIIQILNNIRTSIKTLHSK